MPEVNPIESPVQPPSLAYLHLLEIRRIIRASFRTLRLPAAVRNAEFSRQLFSEGEISVDYYRLIAEACGRQQFLRELLSLGILHRGSAILDVGCGPGLLWEALSSIGVQCKLVGIDISSGMLDDARKRSESASNPTYICGDFHYMDEFLTGQFDVIICVAVNRFIANIDRFFTALHALLRSDGGKIVFRVLPLTFTNVTQSLILSMLSFGALHGKYLFAKPLINAARRHGFSAVYLPQLVKKPPALDRSGVLILERS